MWRSFRAVRTGRFDRELAGILLVAVVVRLVGIGFGFPHPDCRPDEGAIGSVAVRFYRGDLNPGFFNYPALFMTFVAVCLTVWLRVGWALGYLRDPAAMNGMLTPAHVHGIARLVSVAAGVATVSAVYGIAVRLFGRRTALGAALLMALAFLPVRDSHFGVTDTAATWLALLAVGQALRFDDTGQWREAFWGAAIAGLAASTKYNVALAGVPIVLAVSLDGRQRGPTRASRVVVVVAIMATAFLIASPFSLIEWPSFLAALRSESAHLAAGHGPTFGRGWVFHVTSTFRYGVGLPMGVAAILGIVHLTATRVRVSLLLFSFPVVYYVLLGSGRTVFARYMLPVVPFITIGAAYAVTSFVRWAAERLDRPNWAPALTAAALATVLTPSVSSVVAFDRLISRTDNRLIAAAWIEQQFPHGARIAQFGPPSGHVRVGAGDRVREARYPTVEPADPDGPPDVVVVSTSGLWSDSAGSRRARFRPAGDEIGQEYKVAAEFHVDDQDPRNVYDWQDEFYLPLAGFYGITRPGPNLRVLTRRDEDD